jgi:hypothetical protein
MACETFLKICKSNCSTLLVSPECDIQVPKNSKTSGSPQSFFEHIMDKVLPNLELKLINSSSNFAEFLNFYEACGHLILSVENPQVQCALLKKLINSAPKTMKTS